MDPVQGLGGDVDGGVEPDGEVGGVQVVVDGLWAAHGGDAHLRELVEHTQGVLSTNADQGVHA